jgi:hypothetical protein
MIKQRKFFSLFLSGPLIALLLFCTNANSQQSNVMYFIKGVPQTNTLNPAFQPDYGFYFGIPGISPVAAEIDNNPLRFHDLVFYSPPPIDSVITFLHPAADKRKFLALFGNHNFINTDVSTSLFSLGFRINTLFFSFGISQKAYVRLNYPKDLFTLPMYGLLDNSLNPTNLNLSGIAVNAAAYTEFSVGISKSIGDMISVGVRGKILLGEANLFMKTTDIGLNTSLSQWQFHSNVDLNASVPFMQIPKDTLGKYSLDSVRMKSKLSKSDYLDAFVRKPNMGLAIDLGVVIKPMDWLTISASVVDLGYIRWSHNSYNLKQDTGFNFTGINMTGIIRGDTAKIEKMLSDSLFNAFKKVNIQSGGYTSYLPTKIYIGATFNIWSDRISFGLLSITELYLNKVRQSFSLSANLQPIRMFSTSFTYSLLNNTYHDFGFGLALKFGAINTYFIFDYIPTTYDKLKKGNNIPFDIPVPVYSRAFSLKIGMNIVFGGNRKIKLLQDVPLIE